MNQYDKQIEYLTKNPHKIVQQWGNAEGLFKSINRGLFPVYDAGCLTIIRNNPSAKAYIKGEYNEEITEAIRNDERIPKSSFDITVDDLPVFKEWQEKIDKLQNQ